MLDMYCPGSFAMAASPVRSALFVDFDNVFGSLFHFSPNAANAFGTRPDTWLGFFEAGLHAAGDPATANLRAARRPVAPMLPQSGRLYRPGPRKRSGRMGSRQGSPDWQRRAGAVPPIPQLFHPRRLHRGRLPPADARHQELRRHRHGDGHHRRARAPDAIRRVHHPFGRRRLYAGAAAAARARPAHGRVRQPAGRCRLPRGERHPDRRARFHGTRPRAGHHPAGGCQAGGCKTEG